MQALLDRHPEPSEGEPPVTESDLIRFINDCMKAARRSLLASSTAILSGLTRG